MQTFKKELSEFFFRISHCALVDDRERSCKRERGKYERKICRRGDSQQPDSEGIGRLDSGHSIVGKMRVIGDFSADEITAFEFIAKNQIQKITYFTENKKVL